MKIHGKVWKFGNHVNTDDIIAARYLVSTDDKELASHCMETIRPDFVKNVKAGDIIAAGENFGCGSSREHAPVAIKSCGISVVIAKSFARIFLRNSINIGLPLVELSQAEEIKEGDELEINLETGQIKNITNGKSYNFMKYPGFLQEIVQNGGLMKWAAKKYIRRG